MIRLLIFLLIFATSFTQASKKKQKSSKSKLTSIKKSAKKKVKSVRSKKSNNTRTTRSTPRRNNTRENRGDSQQRYNRKRNRSANYSIYTSPYYIGPVYSEINTIRYIEVDETEVEDINESTGQFYDDYPFHSQSLIKNEGKPYIFKTNFLFMPENEDNIQTKEFMMQIDYHYFHLSYNYNYMFDQYEKFIFQNITPGVTIGIPKYNIMLTFRAGVGLMTIEEDRTYGGLSAGFAAFTIVDPNISARFSIDYNSYKDKTNDDETLFNTLKTDFSLGMHFSRLEMRAGFRIKQFMLLDEPYSIRQPYVGFGIWF